MRRMISTLIASVTLATCLGAVLTANNSQRGEGWISAPLASARALGASLVMPKSLPGLPNLRSWLTRNSDTNAVQGADGATVQTDKADYTPYENVIITGSGWQPHETVSLLLREDPPQLDHGDLTYEAVADDSGNIRNDEFWTDYYDIGITFVLTATGQDSGLTAQTTFTDLNIGTYDQCSNDLGTGYTTGDEGCRWINGNLQSNNSIYKEGDATVQRVWLTDFVPGSSHTIRLKYGTTKGGKHAYDFLTTWNWSENWISVADRCQDITGCTSAADTTFNIQMDGSVPDTFEPAFGNANHKFVMRGGNITATSVPAIVTGDYTGDSETVTTVSFTVDSSGTMCETKGQTTTCGVALWFGAHVAAQANWGLGLGAGSISGSPYHVALDAIDGASVGQRDNQMQAGVVTAVPNGTIVIIKDAKPDSAPCRILEQNFSFDLHNTPNTITQSFELDDDGPCDATLSNTTTFSVPPGTWSAAELNIPDGWGLSGLSCAVTGTSTTSVNGATATITLQSNDTVTCTFTNSSAALFCTTDAQCGDNNVCTADICDVSTGICTNPPGNAGTVCRTAAGVCDVAETCTGTSATCPADGATDDAVPCCGGRV